LIYIPRKMSRRKGSDRRIPSCTSTSTKTSSKLAEKALKE
jgi:hypothetical protein